MDTDKNFHCKMDIGKSSKRRDKLLEMERQARKWWEEGRVFNAEPQDRPPVEGEKFFGTFPFPYMNGYLHLGHAFSLSKVEFAAAYHRLRGANVLLPFGFHCTGMPIKASADKLRREIEQFGNPPVFPSRETEEVVIEPEPETKAGLTFKGKKSKVASKTGRETYQWEIMRGYGLSDAEIATFQDPVQWLRFFPPLAVEDLKAFGLGADWRRSFITTDINPFFDKFVRWQMRKLKDLNKIVRDKRCTIYSPLDGQPCADHDRASGEGVMPQEYTLIKMEVVPPFPSKFAHLEGNKKVYLVAATLRPETMYGQTNAWVLPGGRYGAFEIDESEVFITTQHAARNLAFQRMSRVPEKVSCIVDLTGQDLIGLPLRSPLSLNQVIYCLPMLSVLMDKGTGIVTSVPSDSPDDFMALQDLKAKATFRAKFGVKDEWVLPFEVIPIIRHPEYGDKSAEKICTDMKIKSQNEREKLDAAKEVIYKGGFYEGTMIAGEFAGMRVQDAKNKIRTQLLDLKQAVKYSEPERKVMSRSGDECVVALTDQWYLSYGEEGWLEEAKECLANMNLYSEETRCCFESTLKWLKQWACSRSFGLGTRIPWDEEFLVESLSDSTIYMAYYTVCHLLQNGDIFGLDTSALKPEQLTDAVWDYIFLSGPEPKPSDISSTLLKRMRQEFRYWYPVDLRVSGKDLIQNHLTFAIYNHTAIFPKQHWPRGFRCNGHIMLNSEKMSKSTGNFKTLKQAIEEFSADATRFSLAYAGDGMDDANFEFETANAAILRLTKELVWMEEVVATDWSTLRGVGEPSTDYADRVFANEINYAIKMTEKNYSDCMFREALNTGFFDLQAARNEYRVYCGSSPMNPGLLWRFMEVQTRLIAPICPHYSEYVWRIVLQKQGFVIKAGWPEAEDPDLTLRKANKYLQDVITNFRNRFPKQASKKGSGSSSSSSSNKPTFRGHIFVAEEFDGWRRECLNILRDKFDDQSRQFAPDEEIEEALQQTAVGQQGNFNRTLELCMPFLKLRKDEVRTRGIQALDLTMPFSEIQLLRENEELIQRLTGLDRVEIFLATNSKAVPGSPALIVIPMDEHNTQSASAAGADKSSDLRRKG